MLVLIYLFAFLREAAKKFRVHFQRLPWCLRLEHGELFGRRHFHFLMAGLPDTVINRQTCFFLMHLWEQQKGGHPRITVFDRTLNGAAYLTKCLGNLDPGDVYESTKFGFQSSDLMLSHAANRMLLAHARKTERRLAHRKKAGTKDSRTGRSASSAPVGEVSQV